MPKWKTDDTLTDEWCDYVVIISTIKFLACSDKENGLSDGRNVWMDAEW
jgi:hypothetical protein